MHLRHSFHAAPSTTSSSKHPNSPKSTLFARSTSLFGRKQRASPAKTSISYTHAITISAYTAPCSEIHYLQSHQRLIIEIISNHILCTYHLSPSLLYHPCPPSYLIAIGRLPLLPYFEHSLNQRPCVSLIIFLCYDQQHEHTYLFVLSNAFLLHAFIIHNSYLHMI